MMRSKVLKDSSHSFQMSSEINFLISVRKNPPDIWSNSRFDIQKFSFWELNSPCVVLVNRAGVQCRRFSTRPCAIYCTSLAFTAWTAWFFLVSVALLRATFTLLIVVGSLGLLFFSFLAWFPYL